MTRALRISLVMGLSLSLGFTAFPAVAHADRATSAVTPAMEDDPYEDHGDDDDDYVVTPTPDERRESARLWLEAESAALRERGRALVSSTSEASKAAIQKAKSDFTDAKREELAAEAAYKSKPSLATYQRREVARAALVQARLHARAVEYTERLRIRGVKIRANRGGTLLQWSLNSNYWSLVDGVSPTCKSAKAEAMLALLNPAIDRLDELRTQATDAAEVRGSTLLTAVAALYRQEISASVDYERKRQIFAASPGPITKMQAEQAKAVWEEARGARLGNVERLTREFGAATRSAMPAMVKQMRFVFFDTRERHRSGAARPTSGCP